MRPGAAAAAAPRSPSRDGGNDDLTVDDAPRRQFGRPASRPVEGATSGEYPCNTTSFRTLLDDIRHKLAVELLAQDMAVEEIARHLGYAETANLTHAFKRWEGMAPSYFRKSS